MLGPAASGGCGSGAVGGVSPFPAHQPLGIQTLLGTVS